MKNISLFLFIIALFTSCQSGAPQQSEKVLDTPQAKTVQHPDFEKITKSDKEWKEELTEEEYYVLRQAGTDKPFTGDLWNNKKSGTYVCAACQLPLFSSETKFKSGTGWPSFYEPLEENYITEKADNKFGWNRVEVLCARCDGHLGHVFDDGPKPTGLRYCINTAALDFEAVE